MQFVSHLSHRLTMGPAPWWRRRDRCPSCIYDTAVFSPVLLRRLVEDVGAGHVVLGTDHPFELRDAEPLDSVAAAGLPPGRGTRDLVGYRVRAAAPVLRRPCTAVTTGRKGRPRPC